MANKKMYCSEEVISDLRARIAKTSQREIAIDLGLSPQFISDVLRGRRGMTQVLAARLGYTPVSVFYTKKGR